MAGLPVQKRGTSTTLSMISGCIMFQCERWGCKRGNEQPIKTSHATNDQSLVNTNADKVTPRQGSAQIRRITCPGAGARGQSQWRRRRERERKKVRETRREIEKEIGRGEKERYEYLVETFNKVLPTPLYPPSHVPIGSNSCGVSYPNQIHARGIRIPQARI